MDIIMVSTYTRDAARLFGQTPKQVIADAEQRLRTLVPEGSTIHTVLRHTSASGMSRRIDLYVIRDGEFVMITGPAAHVMQWQLGKREGIDVSGAGMDMGFHLVHALSTHLYGDGYALSQRWI